MDVIYKNSSDEIIYTDEDTNFVPRVGMPIRFTRLEDIYRYEVVSVIPHFNMDVKFCYIVVYINSQDR